MALARQFVVSPELQQLLTGMGSRALANVVLDFSSAGTSAVLPSAASAVRRALFYSSLDETAATPTEYDVWVKNLNGTNANQVTVPR